MKVQIKVWWLFVVERLVENLFSLLIKDAGSMCTFPGKMGVCGNQVHHQK